MTDTTDTKGPRFTLPQPKLAALDMPWVVVVGSMGFRAAFETDFHAVTFAQTMAEYETRVGLGHARLGWFDTFDPYLPGSGSVDAVRAWQGFEFAA